MPPWLWGYIVTLFDVFVWPFWNLVPDYVTWQVQVMYAYDRGRYVVLTTDSYLIPIGGCDTKVGDTITAVFDVKIKERMVQSIRGLWLLFL